ncbi:MAG: ATP-dependent sacrificial sulfur transferase LarE [Desulfarculales bacterium]|jgi:uncharacterized protein|nr:ATP-dependent sacrificial sulfur transferase LarE [Desulfarculales bacterium]
MNQKLTRLKDSLTSLDSLAVAFSGGVDSTFLLHVAHSLLGERVLAVTARSCSFPERELSQTRAFCAQRGIAQEICDSEEMEIEGFAHNPPHRCYLCKNELFHKIWAIARGRGITQVAEGSNRDDEGDYRPGLKAVAEQGILSPLRQAGLTKEEIRKLSRQMGLPTWNKAPFACLASRFPYGEMITASRLGMVDRAEQFLLDQGFYQVRVRYHGPVARIETDEAGLTRLASSPNLRRLIYARFREIGFTYTALDILGYRGGSMNEETQSLSGQA